jgi:uncharacterized phage protein (TIGR02218 family)
VPDLPNTPLGDRLAADLTYLALCWRIVRRDGCALGFTTHDQPLLVAGLRYESAPGMVPSAVIATDGLDVDTMDVAGALSSGSISARDLLDGRYDGAAIELFLADWREPDAGRQPLAAGTIGTVEAGFGSDSAFTATLRGVTSIFAAPGVETYSPECRAELGDWRCRVPMRGRRSPRQVMVASEDRVLVAGIDATSVALFAQGKLRVLSGSAAGLERRIVGSDEAWLLLDAPLALAADEIVLLHQGCDKRFSTCVSRFGNAANFRGEPHVPGNDLLTRFGGL